METLKDIFGFWKDTLLGILGFKLSTQNSSPTASVSSDTTSTEWKSPSWVPATATSATNYAPLLIPPSPTIQPSSPVVTNNTVGSFNPNKIISDKEFLNCSSMTEAQIQDFLAFKGSYLKNFTVQGKLPSYWIYKHCNDLGLNPKVLMTNIQKEQASITAKTLPKNQRRLDYFCGVGAYDPPRGDDPKWAGIDKQILGSVQVNVKRFNDASKLIFPYSYTTDKPEFRKLQILNAATRSLYSYTPFVGDQTVIIGKNKYEAPFGNNFFWVIYNKWFGFEA
jgi:hypothetical protein